VTVLKTATTVFGLAFMGAMFSPSGKADDWDRKTVVSFSAPVEIPGVHREGWGVLPAGTYVFKILDSQADRHIVQIFNESQTVVYATILAIPNYRLTATDKTVMTFRERAAGQPEALRAWFYPGRTWGEEFVYPKSKAIAIAKVTQQPVLAMTDEVKVEVPKPEETQVVATLKAEPIIAVKPTGEEVPVAEVVTPPPAETAVAQATTPDPVAEKPATLPETASQVPMIAMFGLLALGGALAVRFLQKRVD
jgi:hypothetical protein